ncbi:AdeC/AdeK/OprM family multidrug efflux complex outer membrane factor [Pseudomonas sp. MAP12]|uniref:AdeC/AdeK/OprM family multidrug efflux complex outer membrane factor n=1 Tax=Geopseudomonas aromaticivorans TaxID=2849492 RepID=A0ABS6MSJ0_9GAMM|nr:AdeC/AdeK/OprM family multidrug efflux complex outer membrane factor [Pseudomonas aromaticivorans]MBV2131389.1 AdeC/AdeK/OprM family multidrug efflux complex outer membrane factor [Pseudomonas aromaticivorans]
MKLKYLTLAVAVALGGCSLIPDYERPAAPVQADWPQGKAYPPAGAGEVGAAALGWQAFFRDPALQRLIGVALDNNRDLRQAALNVEAYRALHRIQRAELFPTVDAGAGGTRQRLPDDLSPSGEAGIQSQYDVSLGIAYELDLFGRLRSLERSALEQYLATAEAQRSVQIALVGDVATAYLTWRTDQAQLALTRSTLDSYTKSLRLIETSQEVGTASALDVRQARSLVQQARVQQALYTRQVAQDVNALQLLLGSAVPGDLPQDGGLDAALLAELPAGLPADLLQQRPDIRAAEHRLRAANADIGAARAAFFPSIRLTAAAGTASSELDGLFDGGSGIWSFVPRINVPIFTAGRLKANLDYAKVQKDINVAQYERSIQGAFREVADGLAARGTYGEQLQAQRDLVDNNREYYQLARQRYDEGVDNYLAVLDAQRELFAAQQQLHSDRLRQLSSEVALYKALGGGWSAAAAKRG